MVLRELGQFAFVAQLVGPPGAAGFVGSHDAHIHPGLLEQGHARPGYRPQLLIVGVAAAGEVHDFGALLGDPLDIEVCRPITPFGAWLEHHVVFVAQASEIGLMLRQQIALVDALDPEFLHVLQGLDVLLHLAGDIAGAVHHALVHHVQEGVVDLDGALRQGIREVVLAAGRIGVPVVPGS